MSKISALCPQYRLRFLPSTDHKELLGGSCLSARAVSVNPRPSPPNSRGHRALHGLFSEEVGNYLPLVLWHLRVLCPSLFSFTSSSRDRLRRQQREINTVSNQNIHVYCLKFVARGSSQRGVLALHKNLISILHLLYWCPTDELYTNSFSPLSKRVGGEKKIATKQQLSLYQADQPVL